MVVYLGGGNDALNTLIPYQDQQYYSRRPTIAIPAGQVLQVGTDASGRALGLHPRLGGLLNVFNEGRLALVQRAGYPDSSRSHFEATEIFGTANPRTSTGSGWLGRYLDTLPKPVDALAAWNTTSDTPRSLVSGQVGVPAISNASTYRFASPNRGSAATQERAAAQAMALNPAPGRPHLAFVNSTSRSAIETIDRAAQALQYSPTVAYPNNGFGNALKMIAGAITQQAGAKLFLLRLGGFDTHARQGTTSGAFFNLMATLDDGISAFYRDLANRGAINDTLIMTISEFGRRVAANSGLGCDHGAGNTMFVIGGSVRGGLYGTAADLNPVASNPTLEANGGDVRHETDFRSLYATIADRWLQTDSVALLQGSFRDAKLSFLG